MKHIAIFASGSGSNAENIIRYFKGHSHINVSLVMSNNPNAYVLERCRKLGVACLSFDREQFYNEDFVIKVLQQYKISFLVLAGFLWLVPKKILSVFPHRIINIHPALLPKFGGKGMYGFYVHSAVVDSGERESGITIHYVTEQYDEGEIIFQAKCDVATTDSSHEVEAKVRRLEIEYFPKVIEKVLCNSSTILEESDS